MSPTHKWFSLESPLPSIRNTRTSRSLSLDTSRGLVIRFNPIVSEHGVGMIQWLFWLQLYCSVFAMYWLWQMVMACTCSAGPRPWPRDEGCRFCLGRRRLNNRELRCAHCGPVVCWAPASIDRYWPQREPCIPCPFHHWYLGREFFVAIFIVYGKGDKGAMGTVLVLTAGGSFGNFNQKRPCVGLGWRCPPFRWFISLQLLCLSCPPGFGGKWELAWVSIKQTRACR